MSLLLILHGSGGGPIQAGFRSLLAFWIGGAAVETGAAAPRIIPEQIALHWLNPQSPMGGGS